MIYDKYFYFSSYFHSYLNFILEMGLSLLHFSESLCKCIFRLWYITEYFRDILKKSCLNEKK